MKYGSICSGIEAATVAWQGLGFKPAWFSEIEPFPCAVLQHHYPDIANLGDMRLLPTKINSGEVEAPDILCGGTPCQAFSVAGLRNSLDDARGNLTLTFCEIADAIDSKRKSSKLQPSIIFWENVPGVLSTKDNAFGCFISELAGTDTTLISPTGRWSNAGCVFGKKRTVAWRVLDAQYFGVAQRRKRVFVVASSRKDFSAAEVLLEFKGLRRDTAPLRESRQTVTPSVTGGSRISSAERGDLVTMAHGQAGAEIGFDRAPTLTCNHEAPIAAYAIPIHDQATRFSGKRGDKQDGKGNGLGVGLPGEPCNTLTKADKHAVAYPIAFHPTQDPISSDDGTTHAMGCGSSGGQASIAVAHHMAVRRLTAVECERLQGFPDGYTAIPWRNKAAADCPDGPRYKALGNSWAVPVVRWIGERIAESLK